MGRGCRRSLGLWCLVAAWVAVEALAAGAEGPREVATAQARRRHAYAAMMYMGTPRDYEFYVATRVMMRSLRRLGTDADGVVIASLDVPLRWVQALFREIVKEATDFLALEEASIRWDCLQLDDVEPDLPLETSTAGDEFDWEEVASASGAWVDTPGAEWEVLGDVPPPAPADSEEGFVCPEDQSSNLTVCDVREGKDVSNDAQGRNILKELQADGVDTSYILVAEEGNSPFTYIIVDN